MSAFARLLFGFLSPILSVLAREGRKLGNVSAKLTCEELIRSAIIAPMMVALVQPDVQFLLAIAAVVILIKFSKN